MSDLINRQNAIDLVEHRMKHNPMKSVEFIQGLQDAYLRVISDLKALPPAEPERKKGKWIEDGHRDYPCVCSVCGIAQDIKAKFLFSFCPNCGADMRERREDEI